MGDITFLRLLAIVAIVLKPEIPWWIWLWAIVIELDHMANAFIDYRVNTLMIKEFEDATKEVQNPGDNPSTPV